MYSTHRKLNKWKVWLNVLFYLAKNHVIVLLNPLSTILCYSPAQTFQKNEVWLKTPLNMIKNLKRFL